MDGSLSFPTPPLNPEWAVQCPQKQAAFVPTSQFSVAIREWKKILGGGVVLAQESVAKHGKNTIGSNARGSAVLHPRSSSDVAQIVKISARSQNSAVSC